jgi:ATP-binding cassette, subfamily B, bacterial
MVQAQPQSYEIAVRSSTPGRIRWRVPALLNSGQECSRVCDALVDIDGVRSVDVSALTASVLVQHNLDWDTARFTHVLRDILAGLNVRRFPRAPLGGDARSARATRQNVLTSGAQPGEQRSGLLRVLIEHSKLARKALLITFVDRLFEASPPALISLAVDSVSRRSDSTLSRLGRSDTVASQLQLLVVAGGAVWTADSTVGYFRSIAAADLANAVRLDLRNELYQHFQTLDLAQIESELPGYWESVFKDDANTIAQYLQDGIDPLVSIIANAVIVLWQLLRVSFGLTLLQLIMVPGLYFISKGLLPSMQQRRRLAGKAEGSLSGLLRSNVQGISTIASFARESYETARVAAAGAEVARLNREAYKVSAADIPLLQMAVGVGFLGTLGIGGLLVNRGRIVAGQLSMIGYSSLRLLQALGYLGVSVDNFQKAREAMRRIEDFRARTPQIQSGRKALLPVSVRGEFKFDQVTFSYPNEEPLFNNLNLTFHAGKTIGIVGQTGAGKSTLLKLLLRYYDVASGQISLDGQPIRSLQLHDLRSSVAYVPQQPFIFPGTIRENIAYSRPGASDEEVARAAAVAAADEFIERLPQGYDTVVRGAGIGGAGQALSGGQAQRVAIARAALANTPVLLFDEATSALDNETEAAIQQSLHNFSAERTTIIVAHRLSMVRRADHIYVLDRGAVREEGTHDELVARDGIYAGFWRVQTGEHPHPAAAPANVIEAAAVEKPSEGTKPLQIQESPQGVEVLPTQKASKTIKPLRKSSRPGQSAVPPTKVTPPKAVKGQKKGSAEPPQESSHGAKPPVRATPSKVGQSQKKSQEVSAERNKARNPKK